MENVKAYKYLVSTEEHYITKKEKHQYLIITISATAILTTDISDV